MIGPAASMSVICCVAATVMTVVGALRDHLPLPAQLMQAGRVVEPPRQGIRVLQVLGQGQRLVRPRQGLLRIAQEPQGPPGKGQACYSRV